MRDRERTFDNLHLAHVEHVAARLRARQSIIHEVKKGLLNLARMSVQIREIAAKSGLQRFGMTERTYGRSQSLERGGNFRRNAVRPVLDLCRRNRCGSD